MRRTTRHAYLPRHLFIAAVLLLTLLPFTARFAAADPEALPGARGTVWATNRVSNTPSVVAFDAATGAELANIPVGKRPTGVVAPEGSGKVYSSDEDSAQVSVISKASRSVIKFISLPALPRLKPHHMIASPDGRYVYVAGWSAPKVAVIDTATDTVAAIFQTNEKSEGVTHAVDVTADGAMLLVVNSTPDGPNVPAVNEIAALDALSGEVLWSLPVGNWPSEVLADRRGELAYVSIRGEDQVEVVDLVRQRVIKEINLGADQPDTLQLTPNGQTLVIGMRDQSAAKVVTVDVGHDYDVDVITMPQWKTTGHNWLSANGRYTFVAVEAWNSSSAPPAIAVIDHRKQEMVDSYPFSAAGVVPHGVFFERSRLISGD